MFKKPPTLANSTQLKSSDRRNLQKHLAESFGIELEEAKALLSESLKQCKASTSAGDHFTLFQDNDGPVAFRLGKGEQGLFVPSLYTVARSSNGLDLPSLVTNDVVLDKLLGGADLFAPGIAPSSLSALPEDASEGSLVAVGTQSVPGAARAVGRLATSASALRRTREGKAVEILHVEGDCLWELGPKNPVQARLQHAASSETGQTSPGEAGGACEAASRTNLDGLSLVPIAETSADGPVSLSPADVDLILHEALLYAISQLLSKPAGSSVFPLSASKFMDTYVLPSRWASSAEHESTIKQSSFKNASSFLKQAKKDGLITTKEAKGGDISVISVNTAHPQVKAFKPYKTLAQLQKQEKNKETRDEQETSKSMARSVEVAQLYKPHGSAMALCIEHLGMAKDDLVALSDLRAAINHYLVREERINTHDHGYINLDAPLSSALLKKGEQLDFMPRSEIIDRLVKSMQAWSRVVLHEGGKQEEFLSKGTVNKIAVSVKKRQGKKVVTIIEGLETYHIPYQKLAEDLQVKCASSATTNELQGSSTKKPLHEVVVQGSQIPIVTRELVEIWGVPKNCLDVHKL